MKPIDIISEIQQKEQLTDKQFAHQIGIQRVHWNKIKHYQKDPGKNVVRRLRERYPYLPNSFFLSLLLGEDNQPSGSFGDKDALSLNFKRPLYVMSRQIKRFSSSAFRIIKSSQPGKGGIFHLPPPFKKQG